MIEICNFKEAFQLYQTNQLAFPVVQDIAYLLMNVCDDHPPNVHSYTDINAENLKWLSGQQYAEFSFNEYLGGDAYICESESDLKSIKGFDPAWADKHEEWPNVTDQPMIFDVCHKLDSEWAVFCFIWNNAGGSTYYVPESLWSAARVEEHLAMNQS
ncbi:hypothetical protein [Methylophilus sp. Leaf408]|uniref:hypothetical protein n=1 Tax=Methylophilus sp. Leaf408 TaxID=2876561 RepID=UPI001E4C6428|nr:hypothetical protein [Methylophilus sp. Leaf408]